MRVEVENPMVFLTHPPDVPTRYGACTCGCNRKIAFGYDDHIVIDDWMFATEECVVEFFMLEYGGRWVYGL